MTGVGEPARSGTAREVPKGRLASFEDDTTPTFTLPPRPGQARSSAPETRQPDEEGESSGTESTRAESSGPEGVDHTAKSDATDLPGEHTADTVGAVVERVPTRDADKAVGPVRASNVHIPVELLEAFNEAKTTQKLSNGELIITAIEATYDELSRQMRPSAPTGGSLFAPRVSRPPRLPTTGPVTPVNYRLRPDDYATLDRLVRDLGASSRSHLISEALRGYLSRTA